MYYKTATQDGYTNEKGEFKYKAGEDIEFILGRVPAKSLITPYTMAGVAVGTDNPKAINIALLLQNLDNDRTDGFLDVSKLKDVSFAGFDLSVLPADIQTKIQDAFTADTFDEYLEN